MRKDKSKDNIISTADEEENYAVELYTEEQMDAVEEHIEKHFGDYPTVFHEIVSPDIHVDICLIPPNKEHDYYTLVTMGMGAHRMNIPPELSDKKIDRAELVICLPTDWKLPDCEESKEDIWYWPIRLLKDLARLPIECDTWLGWGHTVDAGEPYAENTELCGSILIETVDTEEDADVCVLPDGDEVNFYQVIPIYREEMEYKKANNTQTLFEQMEYTPFVVDIERENSCGDDI